MPVVPGVSATFTATRVAMATTTTTTGLSAATSGWRERNVGRAEGNGLVMSFDM